MGETPYKKLCCFKLSQRPSEPAGSTWWKGNAGTTRAFCSWAACKSRAIMQDKQGSKPPSGTKSCRIERSGVGSSAHPRGGKLVLLVDSQAAGGTACNLCPVRFTTPAGEMLCLACRASFLPLTSQSGRPAGPMCGPLARRPSIWYVCRAGKRSLEGPWLSGKIF